MSAVYGPERSEPAAEEERDPPGLLAARRTLPARVTVLALLTWAGLACGTFALVRDTPAARTSAGGESPGCGLHASHRMYIGFRDSMDLDDMIPAARQSRRVLRDLRRQVCGAVESAQHVASRLQRTLRAALTSQQGVEVAEIVFADGTLEEANLELRGAAPVVAASGSSGSPSPAVNTPKTDLRWHLRVARHDDTWSAHHLTNDLTSQ